MLASNLIKYFLKKEYNSHYKIYFSIIHPEPKHMIPASNSLGSISLGYLTINPTAMMNIPNNSKPLAA